MIFTSWAFVFFLILVCSLYWVLPNAVRKGFLLISSYFFYGYIHPWFCCLMMGSTLVDYLCALLIERHPHHSRMWLCLSLSFNLGILALFKYFNFFLENIYTLGSFFGWNLSPSSLSLILPVGISFYTFQSLSYTVDVYRGILKAKRNLFDFALFVSFFPQLVAGPIERAGRLLPQLEANPAWCWENFSRAVPLLLLGFLKKLVVADNVSGYVDKIFMLEHPPLFLLGIGTGGFALQIFADFSAYTDIARGAAQLFGVELMENFKAPYLAYSPSDFWRRWHISFSSWIRDYVYIPLGGSRTNSTFKFGCIIIATMTLSGLWHGAAWNFVLWGLFHGLLLFIYHLLGMGGKWSPTSAVTLATAWGAMQVFTLIGWLLFRCNDLRWLWQVLSEPVWFGSMEVWVVSLGMAALFIFYALPWAIASVVQRYEYQLSWASTGYRWAQVGMIALLGNRSPEEFIYFQF